MSVRAWGSRPPSSSNLINTEVMKISDILVEKEVLSTWIADLANDRRRKIVRMTLNTGRMYYIYGVSRRKFDKWHNQASKGKFFHSNIKPYHDISRGSA